MFIRALALRADQETLQTILGQAHNPTNLCRKIPPGLFIRPHYWSYHHRFQPKFIKTAPALVAPGRKEALHRDIFHQLGIDPLWESDNPSLLASFVSDLGKIKPRTQTRLSTKMQRRMAKAIRRAKMMGLMPLFYNPRIMSK